MNTNEQYVRTYVHEFDFSFQNVVVHLHSDISMVGNLSLINNVRLHFQKWSSCFHLHRNIVIFQPM